MKLPFTITLQNRLALTYALFISLALGLLTLGINRFTGLIFNALIRDNIAEKSGEIVRAMGDLYNPLQRRFDPVAVEAIGMYFVHEGYIITVEDEGGETVWNARFCDMQQCMDVISSIASRMEQNFRLNGGIQKQRHPLYYNGRTVGAVAIETYGPFFYSETETRFLTSLNRLLLTVTAALVLFSIGVSIPLARAIARPVNKSAEAARQIAKAHTGGMSSRKPVIRIPDRYHTRELAELSRSINELASELEEGERRQKQLTADIAHELRTPLTCLQGNMEAMIDGVYVPDREHLVSCHEEILRLINLVKDLHVLTSLDGEGGFPYGSRDLNKTDFDLAKLIQITAEQFRAAAHEKGIALCLDLRESPINADYDRLKQVFVNLLSNAVKYTDSGKITVAITKGAKNWDVVIADTGIGIPEKDIPHVFERFYRTDKSRSRSTGGAGIGLAVAAAIVAAHGGTIDVESKNNGSAASAGTLFRVQLPPPPVGFRPPERVPIRDTRSLLRPPVGPHRGFQAPPGGFRPPERVPVRDTRALLRPPGKRGRASGRLGYLAGRLGYLAGQRVTVSGRRGCVSGRPVDNDPFSVDNDQSAGEGGIGPPSPPPVIGA